MAVIEPLVAPTDVPPAEVRDLPRREADPAIPARQAEREVVSEAAGEAPGLARTHSSRRDRTASSRPLPSFKITPVMPPSPTIETAERMESTDPGASVRFLAERGKDDSDDTARDSGKSVLRFRR